MTGQLKRAKSHHLRRKHNRWEVLDHHKIPWLKQVDVP